MALCIPPAPPLPKLQFTQRFFRLDYARKRANFVIKIELAAMATMAMKGVFPGCPTGDIR